MEEQFRTLFESEYPTMDVIREKLISPIWKDINKSKLNITVEEKDKNKISSIVVFASQGMDINFVDVELQDSVVLKNNRVMINRYISTHIMDVYSSALIFFHYKENNSKEWRITYVYKGENNSDTTNAKRYTYLCGTNYHCRTVTERFLNLLKYNGFPDSDAMIATFSIETLTNDFYKELYNWYKWAIELSLFPIGSGSKTKLSNKNNEENIIRLITRFIFVWFIKQKQLVPDWIFDKNAVDEYLLNFNATSLTEGNYYNAIIQNLFFATLNKDIRERTFSEQENSKAFLDYGIKTLYRDDMEHTFFKENKAEQLLNNFKSIPFLNGGLFECLDSIHTREIDNKNEQIYVDGFSRNKNRRAFVPNALFFQEDNSNTGLINILNKYNFTIEENTSTDIEVALDPELLGKIFENLLSTFNPETRNTARNDSGSFYTPREIVSYMVNDSLKEYLKTKIPEISNEDYDNLFITDTLSENVLKYKSKILKYISEIKVLDPACGSGAFPMGILNKIVDLYKLLSIHELSNKELYEYKRFIIENCIYGIDIQPIAVQISKLRFFISLICEQDKDSNLENYGYFPLPNLETKFVAANTIVQLKKLDYDPLFVNDDIEILKNRLHKIRAEHFKANTAKKKHKLRDEDKEVRTKLINLLKDDNIYSYEDVLQLSNWNPYEQNTSANFFDSEWMFNIETKYFPQNINYEHTENKKGFDIIIGNPPYIEEGKNSSAFNNFRDNKRYYMGKMNIWYGFACLGLDLLKDNGILCFIAKNNWTTSSGAKLLRNQVISDTKILKLIDFNDYMVFKSASIQTMIMLFKKDYKSNDYEFDYRSLLKDATNKDMINLLNNLSTEKTLFLKPIINRKRYFNNFLLFSSEDKFLEKISDNKIYLIQNEATNGIHSHHDFINKKMNEQNPSLPIGKGVFCLSEIEKDSLNLSKNELNLIKPYYTSEQVHKYFTEKTNKLWIIYTDSSFKNINNMNNYPNLKKHLDSVKSVITSDNKPYGLHRARAEHFFKGEKIVVLRKCPKEPIFSFSNFDCYVPASFYVIQTNRWNMKYLTGVLNSKLIKFWLRNRGKMQGENFQLDKEPLMNIPLPINPSEEIQSEISNIVDLIIKYKNMNIDENTEELERNIDKIVYKLYDLTEEEIYFIENH